MACALANARDFTTQHPFAFIVALMLIKFTAWQNSYPVPPSSLSHPSLSLYLMSTKELQNSTSCSLTYPTWLRKRRELIIIYKQLKPKQTG